MKTEDIYNAPKYAGIYLLRNKINGKCYVGQAIKIRKILLHHLDNFRNERYDVQLYKDFNDYGLENFELKILDTFRNGLSYDTKQRLDRLELEYIRKYDSYGDSGYNQTMGNDYGKLVDDMNLKNKKCSDEKNDDVRKENMIHIYDTNDKSYYTFTDSIVAGRYFGMHSDNFKDFDSDIIKDRFIVSNTRENLDMKIKEYNSRTYTD